MLVTSLKLIKRGELAKAPDRLLLSDNEHQSIRTSPHGLEVYGRKLHKLLAVIKNEERVSFQHPNLVHDADEGLLAVAAVEEIDGACYGIVNVYAGMDVLDTPPRTAIRVYVSALPRGTTTFECSVSIDAAHDRLALVWEDTIKVFSLDIYNCHYDELISHPINDKATNVDRYIDINDYSIVVTCPSLGRVKVYTKIDDGYSSYLAYKWSAVYTKSTNRTYGTAARIDGNHLVVANHEPHAEINAGYDIFKVDTGEMILSIDPATATARSIIRSGYRRWLGSTIKKLPVKQAPTSTIQISKTHNSQYGSHGSRHSHSSSTTTSHGVTTTTETTSSTTS